VREVRTGIGVGLFGISVALSCAVMTPLEPGDVGGQAGQSGDGPAGKAGAPRGGSPSGGAGGVRGGSAGVSSGRAGSSTVTGGAGAGGAPDDGGAGFGGACDPVTTGNCHFEFLGGDEYEYLRCDDGASRTLGEGYERLVGATSIDDCETACLARSDCTAVSDYFDEPGLSLCYISTGSCDDPRIEIHSEENAAKDYRKVCPASGPCRFEYVGHFMLCEGESQSVAVEGATSLRDCEEACLARSDCNFIKDFFWLHEIVGCYLFTGACCGVEPLPFGDLGKGYRKVCD
jgi:hypothetical protein